MQENKNFFQLVNNKDNDSDLLNSINDNLKTIADVATGQLEENARREFVRELNDNENVGMSQEDLGYLLNKLSEKPKKKEEDKKISDMNKRCIEDKKNSYIHHDMKELLRNL